VGQNIIAKDAFSDHPLRAKKFDVVVSNGCSASEGRLKSLVTGGGQSVTASGVGPFCLRS
jgi:hypothetical protein